MSTTTATPTEATASKPKAPASVSGPRNYLNAEQGIKSWFLTQDHKRIAILYLISVSFFFLVGGLLAMVIRFELLTPQADLMAPDTYNKIFTMHGIDASLRVRRQFRSGGGKARADPDHFPVVSVVNANAPCKERAR